MLSVDQALHQVLEHALAKPPGEVPLADAVGLVLAEDVASDVDSPPHDKSMVDGYAVLGADIADGRARLALLEEVTAGDLPTRPIIPGFCTRIMTGAPLPAGADSVVMVERTQVGRDTGLAAGVKDEVALVEIRDEVFRAGQNMMPRGKSLRASETVLHRGAELGPAEIGLLAEVGRARVQAIGPVSVAILSTGNELVPADRQPQPGQIRNSNGPLLAAACRRAGAAPIDLGIARDDAAELRRAIALGLQHDVLVISGGVSAGVLDLVPAALAELGVRQVFHKVNMKPGKPLWFGIAEPSASAPSPAHPLTPSPAHSPLPTPHSPFNPSLVFGLPGNPVSSLACFELFVKPAIARIAGRRWEPPHRTQPAKLTREFIHRGDRPTYHPAVLVTSPQGPLVEPTAWHGSADLRGFVGANCLIVFAAGDRRYTPGETVSILPL